MNAILAQYRARILECFINELKNFRRIATRYDQADSSFLGFTCWAAASASGSGLSTQPRCEPCPDTPNGRCRMWVINGHSVEFASRPLYPRKQTSFRGPCTSAGPLANRCFDP